MIPDLSISWNVITFLPAVLMQMKDCSTSASWEGFPFLEAGGDSSASKYRDE